MPIDYDDLEYTPEGIFLLTGVPFSGLATEMHREGYQWCEVPFVDGKEHGVGKSYFSDGSTEGETTYEHGIKHGRERDWFPNGKLKSENIWEFAVLMKSSEYNEQGSLVREYTSTNFSSGLLR